MTPTQATPAPAPDRESSPPQSRWSTPQARWSSLSRPFTALLTTLLLLAGCTSTTPASTPTPPAAKEIAITLANGKSEPNGERVDLVRGQHLVLTITSDREDEVHVHGFDVEIPVEPGQTVTKDIVVDRVGRFEVESHEPAFTILVLQVQ